MTEAFVPTHPVRGKDRRVPVVRRVCGHSRNIKISIITSAQARNPTVSHVGSYQPEYHAFLLRLWRDGARQGWRASLQHTATGQHYHFGSLDELFAFLDARLESEDGERWPKPRPP
jgi:hypothetical protein